MQKPPRPTGVTILAILAILIGIFGLLIGVAIIGLSALISTSTLLGSAGGIITGLGLVLGGIVVFFSLIWLATGFGFLHGKGWAWTLGMIFSVLSLLGTFYLVAVGDYSAILGVLIWGLMVYYLTRSRVKSFFGKGTALIPPAFTSSPGYPSTSPPGYLPQAMNTPTGTMPTLAVANSQPTVSAQSGSLNRFCTNCGASITPGSARCGSCGKTF